jgi:hypothetical protein
MIKYNLARNVRSMTGGNKRKKLIHKTIRMSKVKKLFFSYVSLFVPVKSRANDERDFSAK